MWEFLRTLPSLREDINWKVIIFDNIIIENPERSYFIPIFSKILKHEQIEHDDIRRLLDLINSEIFIEKYNLLTEYDRQKFNLVEFKTEVIYLYLNPIFKKIIH